MARSATAPKLDLLVVSVGCPCGIGPEVSVRAAAKLPGTVLVGDWHMLLEAAELVGVPTKRLQPFTDECADPRAIYVRSVGPRLAARDRKPGKPNAASGAAQLSYINEAYRLTKAAPRRALVTGPVSKAAIAHSGVPGAARFLGHTEWLRDLDGSDLSVMCFAAGPLVTSLVTTHLPIAKVPKAITPRGVSDATFHLGELCSPSVKNARRSPSARSIRTPVRANSWAPKSARRSCRAFARRPNAWGNARS